jgi:hypothetical protein
MIVTLRGQVAELGEPGLKVGCRPVWEFGHAKQLSYKKTRIAKEARCDRCRSSGRTIF